MKIADQKQPKTLQFQEFQFYRYWLPIFPKSSSIIALCDAQKFAKTLENLQIIVEVENSMVIMFYKL